MHADGVDALMTAFVASGMVRAAISLGAHETQALALVTALCAIGLFANVAITLDPAVGRRPR